MPHLPAAMTVAVLLGTIDALLIPSEEELDELKTLTSFAFDDAGGLAASSMRAKELFRLAAQMTEDSWLTTGHEGEQALKLKFNASKAIQAKVQARCAGKEGDCIWRLKDSLLCQLLQLAGVNDAFGSLHNLEKIIMAMLGSTGDIGVDWKARAALIARWKDPIRASTALKASPFADMKNRVLATPRLKSLVNKTCIDLALLRPGCQSMASEAIFCEALAQGSTVAVATGAPHKVIVSKLEELLRESWPQFGQKRHTGANRSRPRKDNEQEVLLVSQQDSEQAAMEKQAELREAE